MKSPRQGRKCGDFFVNLKEWDDKDGNRIYIGGFTSEKDADLKREFGDQFEYKNESGQEQKPLSVSQFAPLGEQMRGAAKPSADSKSVQPKESEPKTVTALHIVYFYFATQHGVPSRLFLLN